MTRCQKQGAKVLQPKITEDHNKTEKQRFYKINLNRPQPVLNRAPLTFKNCQCFSTLALAMRTHDHEFSRENSKQHGFQTVLRNLTKWICFGNLNIFFDSECFDNTK